jgi:hypothetical protein
MKKLKPHALRARTTRQSMATAPARGWLDASATRLRAAMTARLPEMARGRRTAGEGGHLVRPAAAREDFPFDAVPERQTVTSRNRERRCRSMRCRPPCLRCCDAP